MMRYDELVEHMDPLLPVDFFSHHYDLPYVKGWDQKKPKLPFVLPDTSALLDEEAFGKVYIGWHEEGILGKVEVEKEFESSSFPDVEQGDSFELFMDTRDNKKTGFASRFCHHFAFLPEEVNSIQALELTRFRSEDTHPLCAPGDLNIDVTFEKKQYSLYFKIPASCLHGYDPSAFPRIGITYRINRGKGPAQHFTVSSKYFDILQHPSLWASLTLIK